VHFANIFDICLQILIFESILHLKQKDETTDEHKHSASAPFRIMSKRTFVVV
jgi:hypothetical protein